MIDISKDFENELDWKDIELSPSVEDIHAYDLMEAGSAKIPTMKKWSLREDEARFKSSRMDSPYYRQIYKEKKEKTEDRFVESLDLLEEKRWKYKVPESLAKKFALAIDKDNPDYDEIRNILRGIIEFVRDSVGEDNFYEEGLLEDLEYADLENEDDVNYYIDEMYDTLDGYDVWMTPALHYQENNLKESGNSVSPGQAKEILEKLFYKTNEIFKDDIESFKIKTDFDVNTGNVSLYEVKKFKDSDWPIITSVKYNSDTEEYDWESKADYPRDYDGNNGNPFWADGFGEGFGQLLEDIADELGIRGVEEYVGLDPNYQGKYKESYVHEVLNDANDLLDKAKIANMRYDAVGVEDKISNAQGHIRKANMMIESAKDYNAEVDENLSDDEDRKNVKKITTVLSESEGNPKLEGKWSDIINGLRDLGYEVGERYDNYPSRWLLINKDGKEYEAEVTKYFDGSYELMLYNIALLPEGK